MSILQRMLDTSSTVRAVKLEGHLSENRQLIVTVPSDISAGPVEVLIVSKNDKQKASLLHFLDNLTAPASPRISSEMGEVILPERNVWNQ